MTYFVKIPSKFRRANSRSSKPLKMAPVWSFNTEGEAIDFAKSFTVCYVEVWHQGNVIFRNYSLDRTKWMSEGEALVVREQNKNVNEPTYTSYPTGTRKKRRNAV